MNNRRVARFFLRGGVIQRADWPNEAGPPEVKLGCLRLHYFFCWSHNIVTSYLTITSEDHCEQLQDDLDALQKWEATWRMEFNDTKCEVLWISQSKTPIQHTYCLHGTPLKEFDHTKYLGTWFWKDLKWNQHVDEITAKANFTRGFLNKRNLGVNSSTFIYCFIKIVEEARHLFS